MKKIRDAVLDKMARKNYKWWDDQKKFPWGKARQYMEYALYQSGFHQSNKTNGTHTVILCNHSLTKKKYI